MDKLPGNGDFLSTWKNFKFWHTVLDTFTRRMIFEANCPEDKNMTNITLEWNKKIKENDKNIQNELASHKFYPCENGTN